VLKELCRQLEVSDVSELTPALQKMTKVRGDDNAQGHQHSMLCSSADSLSSVDQKSCDGVPPVIQDLVEGCYCLNGWALSDRRVRPVIPLFDEADDTRSWHSLAC
jgi:hypothetical protein